MNSSSRFARFAAPLLAALLLVGCAGDTESDVADDALALDQAPHGVLCDPLPPSWMKTWRTPADEGFVELRVGEVRPRGEIVGDVLFFHGFSDRMDNHRPLFEEWTSRGFRVVSFEYPSHGETCGVGLGAYMYPSLARFAAQVERETREDADRPLLLAGWSMGGLLAVRLLQGLEPLSRPVSGAMLLTPGVAVQLFLDRVREETLTRNPAPPHTGPIAPTRPSTFPIAMNILHHAGRARREALPTAIPVLTVVGGDAEDVYADSPRVRRWVVDKRAEGARSSGLSCPGGYHEIDNEPDPMGSQVRHELGRFATSATRGEDYAPVAQQGAPCVAF